MQLGIQVSGVSRAFGSVQAVADATLSIPPGSVTALIGPNGSGKTTLMLMLATLLAPDAGTITVNGHDPATQPQLVRASMGWMPDVLGSWPTLTVRAALETTGRMYRLSRPAAAARAEELIALTGLEELADRPSRVLSRGQKQRLSLARALVHSPSVLLLDEPASGLDPAARINLRELVRRLAGEGTAVLVSSHVLAELDEMADAAVYLTKGRTASPEALARAGASSRAWRIRSLDAPALAAALTTIGVSPGITSVDKLGTLVQVTGEVAAAELLGRLIRADVPVCDFGPAVGNLEHTFLDLNRPTSTTEIAS
ncbi:ABC transporter ATP-binding protein [Cryobacterium melibiosiphilum]|uniref:ABC transporter ATP-binding protein n=1 Tax=Cryobacterium melibiosiphilum TaxID=995039 RepID=A0A3A5M9Z0_9MICO|nr:ABC transporter ATP-binding protein [Cryobacterium melibiosiphilum]RJT86947.1 ABC transporter ATP-binding protein [Cryobacterium melibiosiphilum]